MSSIPLRLPLLTAIVLLLSLTSTSADFPRPKIQYQPEIYEIAFTAQSLTIDGRADESAWTGAPWTSEFVDIQGREHLPKPRYRTRVKMLADSSYFYIFAEMEEPHLWATYDQHDMVIYHENDFEVFIDPDGDNHHYLELEVNALGTTWDLMLTKPYRDGGHAIDSWEIPGLELAVHLDGTLNDPSDTDTGWTVEIAIPWDVIDEVRWTPEWLDTKPPWQTPMKVNFSRVQWDLDVADGTYVKRTDPSSGDPLPEHNWVWSPQGLIAMHYPEMWGLAVPAVPGKPNLAHIRAKFALGSLDPRHALHRAYYAQRQYRDQHGTWASSVDDLDLGNLVSSSFKWPPELHTTPTGFDLILRTKQPDGSFAPGLSIDNEGRLWPVRPPQHILDGDYTPSFGTSP